MRRVPGSERLGSRLVSNVRTALVQLELDAKSKWYQLTVTSTYVRWEARMEFGLD
jgi:hypothetical protein